MKRAQHDPRPSQNLSDAPERETRLPRKLSVQVPQMSHIQSQFHPNILILKQHFSPLLSAPDLVDLLCNGFLQFHRE